jgi:membrane-bound lytic murein transglycosylase D
MFHAAFRRCLVVGLSGALSLGIAASARAQALDSASGNPAVAEVSPELPSVPVEFLPASSIQSTAVPLLAGVHHLTVPLNQRVLSYIELFQGRLHGFIESGLKRGAQYLPMIQRIFSAQGVPPDLAYVPLIESAFKPEAMSKASAKGVWQFMKGTAVENGLRNDWYIDERSNPEKATLAAANYLKTLAQTFGGDWQLALASYNSGPGRVQQAIKRVGDANFWSLAARPTALPRETREYVPMILAAIVIARNPAQYGFSFTSDEAPTFETIRLPRAVELKKVAEWTGSTVETLRSLNPELRRPMTPIKDAAYALRVPVGTSIEVARRMDEAAGEDLVSLTHYTVKSGDTLPAVARKLHISRADLAEANDLSLTSRLTAGQQLTVPAGVQFVSYVQPEKPRAAVKKATTAPAKKSVSESNNAH